MKTIIISKISFNAWQASIEDWDLGHPLELGTSIQEAIDNLLTAYEEWDRPIKSYKWMGEGY